MAPCRTAYIEFGGLTCQDIVTRTIKQEPISVHPVKHVIMKYFKSLKSSVVSTHQSRGPKATVQGELEVIFSDYKSRQISSKMKVFLAGQRVSETYLS